MSELLDKITQITIYLKGSQEERINEVALFAPLSLKASLDLESKSIRHRKWSFYERLSFPHRFFLKIQTFFFKRLHFLVPEERKTAESKFKTALAILLVQEELRDFFLSDPAQKKQFLKALQTAAERIGFKEFILPEEENSALSMAKQLTTLFGKRKSLIEDPHELNLQIATLKLEERNEIFFEILNQIKRPPLVSHLEVQQDSTSLDIQMTTVYGTYSIENIDLRTGKIHFTATENKATSSIETVKNVATPLVKNQRLVYDTSSKKRTLLGGYCGALLYPLHVLEQILFLLREEGTYFLLDTVPSLKIAEDKFILFTSLFAWNEYSKAQEEHEAIDALHNKILKVVSKEGQERYVRLKLYHQNLPFNAYNKFPIPSEIKANLQDMHDLLWLQLLPRAALPLPASIEKLAERVDHLRTERNYLKKQQGLLEALDLFRPLKKQCLELLEKEKTPLSVALCSALTETKGIDALIYTTFLMQQMHVVHNKNCEYSTDKTAAAMASDKAATSFRKIHKRAFLPKLATAEERKLFEVLYSMYLVWEEPELNAGLSTGFVGEKYYRNFFQKNPEATRYLISWLQKHPEMYLGLSHYR